MATKQQVREQITRVIQEGILTQVLPYQSINGEFDCSIFSGNGSRCNEFNTFCDFNNATDSCQNINTTYCYELSAEQLTIANQFGSACDDFSVTAQSYQSIVGDDGQIQVQQNTTGEQVVIYQEDFQTAENNFNTFVDGVAACFYNDETGTYNDFGYDDNGAFIPIPFNMFANNELGAGISFSLSSGEVDLYDESVPYITTNFADLGAIDCSVQNLSLQDILISLTQFQSLDNTSTQIDPTQAQEILDTTIFELLTQQTTKQQRINQFFKDYAELKPPEYQTDEFDISVTNPDGFIPRLDRPDNDVNDTQNLEWLRDDLNLFFSDDVTIEEDLQIYEERSSGYLKFREMNQAIIIRNTENQSVISNTWEDTGFTITMWVKFKDKISGGTLFNYGNPFRTPQEDAFGFALETYVLNGNEDNKDGGSSIGSTWSELATTEGLNYFDNNEQARFLRLVVKESTPHNNDGGEAVLYLRDSHIGVNDSLTKKHDIARADSPSLSKRFLATTNVPINPNEWYFIVATYNPDNNETIDEVNKGEPLYWTGNCIDSACTQQTYHSGLGNKCKVEIISKTDLLRARGYTTQ